jgi:phosphate transport system substrate-binding protein
MRHTTLSCVALAALTVVATGCGQNREMVTIDGSSTVFLIAEAVAEEFQRTSDIRVTVGISGTGGGFQRFCRGETDITNASRPIRPTEIDACARSGIEYIELPVAYDGIAVVVNPRNTWVTHLTVEELKTLWAPEAQGRVTRWNQVRASWPDREIRLFGAGVDSGTYDYFTEAIVGKEGASRGDFTSSEDDNVLVQGIAGDELGLGFLPLAYYEENQSRLKMVPIDDRNPENGDGPIAASIETVRNGTYQPLSRPLFTYVSRMAAERPAVQQFIDAYLSSPELVREVGYVELTPRLYELARAHFAERRTGTAFGDGGSQVGMTLEALLTREQ